MAAFASSTGGASVLPYESWLSVFEKSMTGPVATSIALIGIVTSGASLILMGGEINRFVRSLIFIILVMAMLLGANSLMTNFFNGASIGKVPSTIQTVPAQNDINLANDDEAYDAVLLAPTPYNEIYHLKQKSSDLIFNENDTVVFEPTAKEYPRAGLSFTKVSAANTNPNCNCTDVSNNRRHATGNAAGASNAAGTESAVTASNDDSAHCEDDPVRKSTVPEPSYIESDLSKVGPAPYGAFDNNQQRQQPTQRNDRSNDLDQYIRQANELVRLKNIFSSAVHTAPRVAHLASAMVNGAASAHGSADVNAFGNTVDYAGGMASDAHFVARFVPSYASGLAYNGVYAGSEGSVGSEFSGLFSYAAHDASYDIELWQRTFAGRWDELEPENFLRDKRSELYQGMELSLKTKAFSIDSDRRLQGLMPEKSMDELKFNETDNLIKRLYPHQGPESEGLLLNPPSKSHHDHIHALSKVA